MTELLQSIESIEEAINSIPQLEASLRTAFLALQPHSQLLHDHFQFPRQWQEIETHLQSVSQSIKSRFSALLITTNQPEEGLPLPPSKKFRKELAIIIEEGEIPELDDALEVEEEEPLPESKGPINASGLLDLTIHNDRASAQIEISRSLQAAADPVTLVLDCADFGVELGKLRVLFETLETVKQLMPEIEISVPAKKRALRRAVTWKYKYGMDFRSAPEEAAAAFLHFLIAFEIVSEFRAGKVCMILAQVLPVEQLLELCHALQYMVRIPVVLEKMAEQGKDVQILAKILFEYLQYSKKTADSMIQNANDSQEQIEGNRMKVHAYKSVINCVARYELEPVFPVKLSRLNEIKSGLQASLKNKMKKEEEEATEEEEDDKLDVARQVLEQTKAKLEMQLAMATQNSTSVGSEYYPTYYRDDGFRGGPQSGFYHDRETSYGRMPPVEAGNSYLQNERVALFSMPQYYDDRKYPPQSWR